MGTTAVSWSVDVTVVPGLKRDVNVFVCQNVNGSLSNRTHQFRGGGVRQTNNSQAFTEEEKLVTFEVALEKAFWL